MWVPVGINAIRQAFTGAAIRSGRHDLAGRALAMAREKLPLDNWPEYYDGRRGTLIGRRANLNQVWSATGLILAHHMLHNPDCLPVFESFNF